MKYIYAIICGISFVGFNLNPPYQLLTSLLLLNGIIAFFATIDEIKD